VRLEELEKIRSTGADEITFTLSSGGRTETPVNKSASGGELSRILLAIQLSLPKEALPPTLIFDEVEAGLGGRAAVLAGYKLLELSRRCQVILVTHEGTIAALADSHFMVSKKGESVEAQKLQYGERVKEIARMLSGDSGLPEAVEHARILLSERRGGS
jgi:DNA repair protein RecN (Recombination protein N)